MFIMPLLKLPLDLLLVDNQTTRTDICKAEAESDEARGVKLSLPNDKAWENHTDMARVDAMLQSDVRCLADTPIPNYIQYMAEKVPESKFVIWPRDAHKWAESAASYFSECGGTRQFYWS